MYLILTLAAALVATILWRRKRGHRLELLCFMYWGASLMWLVDGIVSVAEGGPFFEMTTDAALLGALVVVAGLAVWGVVLLAGRRKYRRAN